MSQKFTPGQAPPPGSKPFDKGKSGNPGGQTKAAVAARRMVAELISSETDGGKEIVLFALNVMRGEGGAPGKGEDEDNSCWDQKSQRWAADFLANRLWGKAPLVVEVTNGDESALMPDMRGKSLEELRRLAAGGSADDGPANVH